MIVALVEALRPKQWTKNALLFVGVVFSQHLRDGQLLGRAAAPSALPPPMPACAGMRLVSVKRAPARKERQPPRPL